MNFQKEQLLNQMNDFLIKLEDDELSHNTLKKYKNNITSFINFTDNKPICKDTVKSFRDYLEEKNYLISTANNYLIVVNKFLKSINMENLCVKTFRVQRRDSIDEYISYTDYHRLLRCSLKNKDVTTYLILRILAETGIRVAELKYFKVETLNRNIIVKNKNKTRTIIVNLKLLSSIRKYLKENHIYNGYIFPGKNGKPLHESSIRKKLKKAAGYTKIKLSKVHPHSFRHYFAIRFLEQYPDDVLTLSDLLGHTSLETTRIYTRLSNNQKERRLRDVKF